MKARILLCAVCAQCTECKCKALCYPHLVFFSRENRLESSDKRYLTFHISMCCCCHCHCHFDVWITKTRYISLELIAKLYLHAFQRQQSIDLSSEKVKEKHTKQHRIRAIFMFVFFFVPFSICCICCAEARLHYTLATNLKLILVKEFRSLFRFVRLAHRFQSVWNLFLYCH